MTATPATRPASFEAMVALRARMGTPEEMKKGLEHGLAFRPRPSDVIISPFGKCGTTWLQQVFHGLRTRGDMDFDDISRVVPWIETAHDLGLDLDAPQRGAPRGYKSHLPYDLVPKGARYIVSIRNPKDALVSVVPVHGGLVVRARQHPDRDDRARSVHAPRGAPRLLVSPRVVVAASPRRRRACCCATSR